MRRLFILLLILSFTFWKGGDVKAQSMGEYCYVPPYVAKSVKPNVLFVMDFSGSMQFPAYVPCDFDGYDGNKIAQCGSSNSNYDPSLRYDGYFDPDKCYKYSSNNFEEENCDCSNKIGTSSCISGNLLNWISTTRIDIARKVLTGGRSSSAGGNTFLDSEGAEYTIRDSNLKCEFTISATQTDNRNLTIKNYSGTCPLGNNAISNARLRIKPSDPSSIKGIIHRFCDTSDMNGQINEKCSLIMEFMVFASDNRYGEIKVGKQATISELISAINNELPYWGTPTGEALWEAYDFYKQSNDHNYEANNAYIGRGNGNKDPYYDGSGNNAISVPCRKGFVLLLSDGAWNGNVDPVRPARTMATTDLRDDLAGIQNVYTYAIYAFGDLDPDTRLQGRQAMITTAIFGGFEDKDGSTWPYPFTNYPSSSRQVTYPLSQCNPTGTWNEGCREWDTLYNSPKDGLPYNFYEANDAESLKDALLKALYDILRRASSGSTVATLTGRSSVSQVVIQPYFLPSYTRSDGTPINWLGFLRSFWVDVKQNLREDTNLNKILNLVGDVVDKVFQLFFDTNQDQTRAALLSNADTCTVSGYKSINELKPVFDSGCALAEMNPSDRKIYYNKDGTLTSLTTGEASYFNNIWKVCSNNESKICNNNGDCTGGGTCQNVDNTSCVIRYLRGEDAPCSEPYVLRPRTLDVSAFCSAIGMSGNKVWKLGDIISSSPAVAGSEPLMNYHFKYNDQSYYEYINSDQYKKRPTIVAISANDGMLHIFRVGYIKQRGEAQDPVELVNSPTDSSANNLVGKEEFAFVPRGAIPYLLWYGHPSYCHIPTVDYRVYIFDAKINNQWKTLLIGTMGFGGKAITVSAGTFSSSVFVLDLTDWLNNNLSGTPTLLWERQLPDNTLTLSFPAIAKVGNNWYVLVGSGPSAINSNTGESFVNDPKIYVFNLADGSPVRTLDVNVSGADVAVGDIMPVDIDNDYSDEYAYFGVYGKRGSGRVYGALYRINLSSWTISQAFDFGSSPPPIFGAPTFTLDENNNLWVFFGTGKYLSNADKSINYTNYLVGFKDTGGTTRLSDLTDTTGRTITVSFTQTQQMCICDSSGCGLKPVVVDASGTIPAEVEKGWYIKLNKEALYSQPAVFGGVVNALSAVLPQDVCSAEGSSKLYSLYYKSGTPFPRPTILAPKDVVLVGSQIQQSVNLGRGIPPLGNPFQITAGSGKEFQSFLQVSTGVILKVPQQVTTSSEGRFILWIEK